MRRYLVNFTKRSDGYGQIISSSCQPTRTKSYITQSLREPHISRSASTAQKENPTVSSSGPNVTRLSNGLTVASLDAPGGSCTLGVLVNSGAKNECHHPSGVSHFLEKLAFNATEVFPNREDLVEEMVRCGGVFECQTSKDITIYAMSGKTQELNSLVRVLGEVVLRPRITDAEVELAMRKAEYEIQVMGMLPPPDNILTEMIHKAAYSRNSYGLPKYCPVDNLSKITRSDLLTFLAAHFRPEEMVVAAVGVSHEDLLSHVDSHFLQSSPTWEGVETKVEPRKSVAQYTGGIEVENRDLAAYHQPMPEFAHLVLGLETCASTDPQYVAAAVLQTMMGGGGSFSAGGPGKGMFTRLFTRVLNQHHWVNSAVAQLHCYTDSGLFAISASAEPRYIPDLVVTISNEMRIMAAGPISDEELARAKRQLQSTLLMNLELRPIAMEDLGRQILAYRERRSPEWWFEQIEKVTEEDVREIAQRMFKSRPSVVGFGRVEKLPPYETITRLLTTKDKFIPRIFSVYK